MAVLLFISNSKKTMKSDFLRFCIVNILVLICVSIIDLISGIIINKMLSEISNQGEIGRTYFSLNEVDTPIVIVGSSRASHHYVTI